MYISTLFFIPTLANGNATSSPAATNAAITTGDVIAGTEIATEVNINSVNTTAIATSTDTVGIEADDFSTTTDHTSATSPAPPEPYATSSGDALEFAPLASSSDVALENVALASTSATTSANTGLNNATADTVSIATGDAIAYLDVLNVVNTNIVDSTGLMQFVNDVLDGNTLDLREEFFSVFSDTTALSTPACSDMVCGTTGLETAASNTATIDNHLAVLAHTGGNNAHGSSSTITTGNAYASAQVVNVVNTNIVDSNYLLLVFDNFSSYSGDIVLPTSSVFDTLFGSTVHSTPATTNIDQAALISNNVTATADTGYNSSTAGTITTGNSHSSTLVQNIVNQTFLNTGSFSMLIRVQGDWSGGIYGLPEGMSWEETADGIRIYSTLPSTGAGGPDTVTLNNTATINNDVKVFALTGANEVTGAGDITTGHAYTNTGITNLVNTNIVGSNWANLIFNIYGSWGGNLMFGENDLWLGLSAHTDAGTILPGDTVRYTFTVFNAGDAKTPNVRLTSDAANGQLHFSNGITTARNETYWNLGAIEAGETKEITVDATIDPAISRDRVSAVTLAATVKSAFYDANPEDNSDQVTIMVGEHKNQSKGFGTTFPAKFEISKSANRSTALVGQSVDYTVTFMNRGGQLFDAVLADIMTNASGTIVSEQFWPLDTVRNGETFTYTYTLKIDGSFPDGMYTNSAQVIGYHGSRIARNQTTYESPLATHTLAVGEQTGTVLGLSTSCQPYLTTYLRPGVHNNPTEVVKLQHFLNERGAGLGATGIFDTATEGAVRNFQSEYTNEILEPWGLSSPTGIVYYTTQKKINDMMCGGSGVIPLTVAQTNEIALYRAQKVQAAASIRRQ